MWFRILAALIATAQSRLNSEIYKLSTAAGPTNLQVLIEYTGGGEYRIGKIDGTYFQAGRNKRLNVVNQDSATVFTYESYHKAFKTTDWYYASNWDWFNGKKTHNCLDYFANDNVLGTWACHHGKNQQITLKTDDETKRLTAENRFPLDNGVYDVVTGFGPTNMQVRLERAGDVFYKIRNSNGGYFSVVNDNKLEVVDKWSPTYFNYDQRLATFWSWSEATKQCLDFFNTDKVLGTWKCHYGKNQRIYLKTRFRFNDEFYKVYSTSGDYIMQVLLEQVGDGYYRIGKNYGTYYQAVKNESLKVHNQWSATVFYYDQTRKSFYFWSWSQDTWQCLDFFKTDKVLGTWKCHHGINQQFILKTDDETKLATAKGQAKFGNQFYKVFTGHGSTNQQLLFERVDKRNYFRIGNGKGTYFQAVRKKPLKAVGRHSATFFHYDSSKKVFWNKDTKQCLDFFANDKVLGTWSCHHGKTQQFSLKTDDETRLATAKEYCNTETKYQNSFTNEFYKPDFAQGSASRTVRLECVGSDTYRIGNGDGKYYQSVYRSSKWADQMSADQMSATYYTYDKRVPAFVSKDSFIEGTLKTTDESRRATVKEWCEASAEAERCKVNVAFLCQSNPQELVKWEPECVKKSMPGCNAGGNYQECKYCGKRMYGTCEVKTS